MYAKVQMFIHHTLEQRYNSLDLGVPENRFFTGICGLTTPRTPLELTAAAAVALAEFYAFNY